MNLLIAAETSGGLPDRVAKWLINFDYDAVEAEDLTLRFLGMPEGWGLLLTFACVAALVWLTFALYRREGRTASRGRKLFLAGVRTAAILLALLLFLEPTLFESRVRETLSPVIVLVDGSESITIDDLYSDPAAAAGVAAATGLDLTARKRITRQEIIAAALNNPATDFLNRLAAKNPVHVYSFGVEPKELLRLGLARDPEKIGNPGAGGQAPERFKPGALLLEVQSGRTYIGRAVNAILEQAAATAPGGLAAVIVISDGQDNDRVLDATASAGEYAAREGVTVFAVPVGPSKSRKTRNIKAAKGLQVNRTLFVGDPAEFVALVSSSGYERPMRIVAKLYRKKLGSEKEEEVASKEESVGVDAVDQPVALKHTPQPGEEGEYVYTLRIAPLDDEHLRRDNAAVAGGIRVVKTSTNVLLIAGSPTWEFRRLRGLLIRDKSVTLSCWLQSAGKGYPQVGNRLLRRLPRSRQELAEADYHVVILIDVDPDPAAFDADWFKMLEAFVSDKAGGLLYVAGEKEEYTLALFESRISAPLRNMLPVELDIARARLAVGDGYKGARAWPLKPTEDGLSSPLLRFSTEREITERVWQSLPGAVWTFPVRKAKAHGTVLMRTLDPSRSVSIGGKLEPMPVLVTSFYGRGRVAFMGFDETWRWRRRGTRFYDTFWTQCIRSLVEGRLMGGRKSAILETDSESYPLGEAATISAKVFDASGKPARLSSVAVKIEMAAEGGGGGTSGRAPPVTVQLMPVPGSPGTYKLRYVPQRTGFYKLSLTGYEAGAAATTSIEVASQFEFDHPEANRVRLAELTDAGVGGGIVELKDLAALPERIDSKRKQVVEQGDQLALWANPLALGLMTALFGVEWMLRKRANMA